MSLEDSNIHTAYHEIGHWLAAEELGILACGISIIPDKDDGTAGRVGVEGDDGFGLLPGTDPFSPETEGAFRVWALEQATIDYAGHAAVVALLGTGNMSDESAVNSGAGEDFEKARERLGDDDARIADAKNRAIQIVTKRRHESEVIADKLMLLGRLDAQQIDILVGGKWSIFFNEDGSRRI